VGRRRLTASRLRRTAIGYRPSMSASDPTPERNSPDRRSQGEEYPGHGDAGSLEEQYGAPDETPDANEEDAGRDEEGKGE
jgi:hypothetical protein